MYYHQISYKCLVLDYISIPGETIKVSSQADSTGWYWIGILDLNGKIHDTDYAFQVTLV
jgi:hypothetical protein